LKGKLELKRLFTVADITDKAEMAEPDGTIFELLTGWK